MSGGKWVRLTVDVEHARLVTEGFEEATRGLRLEGDGTIVIPRDLGGGVVMLNPAPCGTWEVV